MANFILYYICITLPTLLLSNTITKSVTLTPIDNNINGVAVTSNNIDVIPTFNKWNIDVSNNNGWHLHISMNHSWNFLSNQPSTISLKTYINSTITKTHKDIIFIFSQNNNKYITSTINIDSNNINNGIYPHCNTYDKNIPMSTGNINILLNNNNESNNREYKLTQGTNYDISATNTVNISPYIIQLINNPINNWSKYIYNNQQCQFESFSTDIPIDIYISAADIGQVLSINKFEIIFKYNDTGLHTQILSEPITTIESKSNKKDKQNVIKNDSSSGILMQLNMKVFVIILIGVTIILVIICIGLILMVRMEHITNSKTKIEKEQLNPHNIDLEMASDLVLHVITFRNEETSKKYSFESNTSLGSQFDTDYQKFDTNNKNNDNNNTENDMDVIRDMK